MVRQAVQLRLSEGPEERVQLTRPPDPSGSTASPLARLAKWNHLWFQVPNGNKSPRLCEVFPLPHCMSSPRPPRIYILVLGLTQFLQEFLFHLPKLDTDRHLGYELLAALLGDLLAVPQVDVADVAAAFEEGEALVSDLIAV